MPFLEIPAELVMDELHLLLEEGRNYINNILEDRGFRARLGDMVKSQQTFEASRSVVIQIGYVNMPTEPVATRAKEDKYLFNIDVQITKLKKIEADALTATAAHAVRGWLNRNLANFTRQVSLTGVNWYHCWAGDVVMGTKDSGALRVARIPWECRIYNIYS